MNNLKKTLKLPVTSNWILGGLLVASFYSLLKWVDPHEFLRIEYWELWLIFFYDLTATLYLNLRLAKGIWSIQKWTKLSFIFWYVPMVFANAYLAASLDHYLIVTIATLYAGFLGVVGIFEKRYFLFGGVLYSCFYLALSILIRGMEEPSWVIHSIIYSIFSLVSLYWLSLASHFVSSQNKTIQKLLRDSRKSKRELAEERKTIKDLVERLNKSFTIIKKDLSTAKKIQESILPGTHEVFNMPIDICCRYFPMNEVGGDIYDVCRLPNGKIRIFLADATGHGVQGALITMLIKVEYEFLKVTVDETSQVLEILNRDYYQRYRSLNMFYTCILVDIDLNSKKFTFASAGHPSQIFIHQGKIHPLERTGRMIGISGDTKYESQELGFGMGDRFLWFSDGIFEQFNNLREEYGEDRIHNHFLDLYNRKVSISNSVDEILDELYKHLGDEDLQDDITVIGCDII